MYGPRGDGPDTDPMRAIRPDTAEQRATTQPVAAVSVSGAPQAGPPPAAFPAGAGTANAPASAGRGESGGKDRRRKPSVGYAIVGVIGELMITLGVFLGLFVVWQLVWTDFQAGRVQAAAATQLEEEPTWTQANPSTDGAKHTDDPPIMAPPPKDAEIGFLHVPRWGTDYKRLISQGVDKKTVLDRLGIGHYPDTQMPGEMGNFAVAGHRVTYSKPFNLIHELKPGDAIIVETADTWYVYKMVSFEIVKPSQYSVVYPNPGGDPNEPGTRRLLTMTACHPQFSARERYVVHAEMEYWEAKSEGTPIELTEKPAG